MTNTNTILVKQFRHVIFLADYLWLAGIWSVVAYVAQHFAHLRCAVRRYLHAPPEIPVDADVVHVHEGRHP